MIHHRQQLIHALTSRPPGKAVLTALGQLLEHDAFLLQADANERAITHRFAMYLQAELPDWHVDCEYNRDKHDPKVVNLPRDVRYASSEDTDAVTVFPDVIVHRRNTDENYLVIEFKKSNYRAAPYFDVQKLEAYVRDLGYQFALFIELGVAKSYGGVHADWIT